ncbi:MAG: hypothetical protein FJ096_14420, partial [Deltaproteobacteria bacterium]|nr:hypothetical protein [Deltaproteobacteria bacterium]
MGAEHTTEPSDVARLVAVLLTTDEHELEGFRRRCLGRESQQDLERLKLAQRTLLAVGRTVASLADEDWAAVAAAEKALLREALPVEATLASGIHPIVVDLPPAEPMLPSPPSCERSNSSPWIQGRGAFEALSAVPAWSAAPPPAASVLPVEPRLDASAAMRAPIPDQTMGPFVPAQARATAGMLAVSAAAPSSPRHVMPFESHLPVHERTGTELPRLDALP